MAEITRLHKLIAGVMRGVDLASNTLVVLDLKVGGASGSTLTKTILDKLIDLQSTDPTKRAALYSELEAEATLRTNADTALGTRIDDEETARIDADELLDTAITAVAGDLAQEIIDRGSADSAIEARVVTLEGKTQDLNTLSGVAANATHLGTFTGTVISDDRTIKQALQELETYSENTREIASRLEWENSVATRTATPPVSPASGDRVLVIATATGAFAGHEDQIAEFNGSAWTFKSCTVGTFVGVDDEPNGLYVYEGSGWSKKFFEATTASTGLTKVGFDVRLADADSAGVKVDAGAISVNVDNSTIERGSASGNPLQVKDAGVTAAKLATDSVETAKIKDANVTKAKIASNAVDGSKIQLANNENLRARNAADSADVDILKVNASNVIEFASIPQAAGTPSANNDLTNKAYVDAQAAAGARLMKRSVVVGEAMAANSSIAVRWAVSGETAGRVYKADKDASVADKFHVVGMVQTGSSAAAAGDTLELFMMGSIDLVAADVDFVAADVGKPVYLGASGAFTVTPPSNVGEAAVIIGYVENTDKLDVRSVQIMGVG